jgi:hypothetical protein
MWKHVVVLTLLLNGSAWAGDHLEPEDSQFSGLFMPQYNDMVIDALGEAYADNVRARAMVFPSFSPEYAVGILSEDEKYKVFHLEPEKQYWGYMSLALKKSEAEQVVNDGELKRDAEGIKRLEEAYPENYEDIEVQRCRRPFAAEVAEKAVDIWLYMLLETRYSDDLSIGLDGTTYHFSAPYGHKILAGKVWSPASDSKTGKLVAIINSMVEYCKEKEDSEHELRSRVTGFYDDLGIKDDFDSSPLEIE